jgi:cell division septation protein DedD
MPVDEIAKAAGARFAENRTLAGSPRRAMIDAGARRASPPLRDGESATPARSGSVDPLAQLARLIEQDEAFGAIVRNSGRSAQGVELSERRERPPSSLARADNPFAHERDGDRGAPVVPSYLREGTSGEPRGPHEDGVHDNPDYSNGLPNERRGLRMFAAVLGLALAGSASAMAYWAWSDGRVRSDETRVISASLSPDKIMPPSQRENGRSGGQSDEQSVNVAGGTTAGEEKPAEAEPAAVPQAPPPAGVLYGPAPAKVAALTPAAPPVSPAGTAENQPPDAKEPAPGQTAPGATEPGGAPENRFVVQLSSQRSEAAAQTTSRTLQTKYPDVFGGRQPYIRRSDLGDRGVYYRVLMGPFSIGEAKELCGNLKKSSADCVVQKN